MMMMMMMRALQNP